MQSLPLLSALIWIPALSSWVVLLIGRRHARAARGLALLSSLAACMLVMPLLTGFDPSNPNLQFVERHVWIDHVGAVYYLGVNGASPILLGLTAMGTFAAVLLCAMTIERGAQGCMALLLSISGILSGVFAAASSLLFCLFCEAILIPVFIIICSAWRPRASG